METDRNVLMCVYSQDFIMGGIESYFVRMFEWALKNNYRTYLILGENSKIHHNWKNTLAHFNVNIGFFSRKACTYSISLINGSEIIWKKNNIHYTIIAADLHSYFKLCNIINKFNLCNVKLIFYVFHPLSVVASQKKFLNFFYNSFMRKYAAHNMIFMDEETKLSFEKIYKTHINDSNIFRLGMKIFPLDKELVKKRVEGRNDFTILTITRMEFPFKGYILGLIDDFAKIKKQYPNVNLTIIGTGKDQFVLENKINNLPDNIKSSITYIHEVPYEQLQYYFKASHLYIGMGTTLLDASMTGLISIIATAFQKDNKSPGFFFDKFNNLGGNLELSQGMVFRFESLINEVLVSSDSKYIEWEHISYDTVKNNYDIDKIMDNICISMPVAKIHKPNIFLKFYDSALARIQRFQIEKNNLNEEKNANYK